MSFEGQLKGITVSQCLHLGRKIVLEERRALDGGGPWMAIITAVLSLLLGTLLWAVTYFTSPLKVKKEDKMKQKVWGCSWGCPWCEWSPTLVPQYFGSPCLVSQTAACRDAGGTGSPCLPRQGQLAKISFLHPGLLFTHCSILLMRAGSAQVEGGHPGAKAVPRPVQISYHRWLSFPEPDFTSVLQITLGTALHWCWVTKIPVVSWKRVRSSLPSC